MLALTATASEKNPLEVFFDLAIKAWWVWVLVAGIGLVRLAHALYVRRRLGRSGIAEIDRMDGRTFERYLETMFERLGYRVELTKYRGDYGADLVIAKKGRRIAVQAKRYAKPVGLKAVQEAVASKGMYRCDAAMVVANRTYTAQARKLAEANDVELWDRDRLVHALLTKKKAPAAASTPTPAPTAGSALAATADDQVVDTSICALCGTRVSEKVRLYCLDHPKRFGGLVYCFKHQRGLRRPAST